MIKNKDLIKNWYVKPITDTVRLILSEGAYPTENTDRWEQFLEDVDNDRLLAMLETPSCDIELEMWTTDGDNFNEAPDKEDKRISLSLPILVKVSDTEDCWEISGYAEDPCTVDFASPTWEQDLKEEMWKALCKYANYFGLSLTEINTHAA